MTDNYVNVAFCNDEKYEAGLHVTLYSLLKKFDGNSRTLRIFFFFKGFSGHDIARLHCTLRSTGKPYELIARECNTSLFRGFPRLHGNYLTYIRLVVPEIVKESRIVFMDSDVIVN